MSLQACAELVARGDPDRFRATMAAPVDARRVLFPLYAFNIEVSRAPWVTAEPMIAEMRLQFWRDVVEELATGKPPRAHQVIAPLAAAIPADLVGLLDGLITARRWDIYSDPFEDRAQFDAYVDQTSGSLVTVAARALGAAGDPGLQDPAHQRPLGPRQSGDLPGSESRRRDRRVPRCDEGLPRALSEEGGHFRFLANWEAIAD